MGINSSKIIFWLQFWEVETRKKSRDTSAMRNGVYFERTREVCGRQHKGLAVQHGKRLAAVHNCWVIPRILSKIKTESERRNKTYKHELTRLPVPNKCSKSKKIGLCCDGQREYVISKLQRGFTKYVVPESNISGYVKG